MIKIPKQDVRNCRAFKVPYLRPSDQIVFVLAKIQDSSVRESTFARGEVFSEEKFVAYIESGNPGQTKVLLHIVDPNEELYHITACNFNELMSALHGNTVPKFCINYDWEQDRLTPRQKAEKQFRDVYEFYNGK